MTEWTGLDGAVWRGCVKLYALGILHCKISHRIARIRASSDLVILKFSTVGFDVKFLALPRLKGLPRV